MSRQGLKTIKFLDKITVGLVVAAGAAWAAKHQWEADKPETSSVPKASK